jgi:hypothetical protein
MLIMLSLFILPRQAALNFRLRTSALGYFRDWHVAGGSTLILIHSGILRIGLRDGSVRDFASGDVFIAQDKLNDDKIFDKASYLILAGRFLPP